MTLSEPDPAFRLGNLMADLVRPRERARLHLPEQFLRGCACHQVIDSFIDAHPCYRADRQRIQPALRRYSGILVDIFYDHALARDWEEYFDEPLEEFAAEFHRQALRELADCPQAPPVAAELMQDLITTRRFISYRSFSGIEEALARLRRRLEKRWNRAVPLTDALADLEREQEQFAAGLRQVMPEIRQHLGQAGYRLWTG